MDDGIDIYGDLPNFNTNETEDCSANTIEVAGKCDELTKQVNELTERVKKLEKDNEILEVNITSLLKTAKAEIARKDRMIADLREQLDNALFRRAGNHVPYSQPKIKKESNPRPVKEERFIQKPQYTVSHVHTTENEVTSTDIDYSTPIEEEHSEKKAVEGQKKLQETVYGKRLRKRIIEKEHEEAKEASRKYKESVGSSVVESNKENAIVNKLDTAVESCVGESKKGNESNQSVDKKTGHFQASQKYSNTDSMCQPVGEGSDKYSMATHSSEVPGKRLNEDATNLPSSKRKRNNEDHYCDMQYGSESKHTYHEGKNHDKYDRKKCERRYSEEEMFQSHESKFKHVPEGSNIESHYDNYERKHYSRRDIDDKRDNYRHRNTDRRPSSRSRERSREKSKEKSNYHEKCRENSAHYNHDKSYQPHNRGSDRKYSHKSYDKHYSNDRGTFRSNSRKPDGFKEKDSSSCRTFHRNGYDLRDKVENRYEKKSDYIYYESNKYKRNNRYGTETLRRSRRSLSEIKEEVESSKRCKKSEENIKQEIEEIRESKPEIRDNVTVGVKSEMENVDALEEGEVLDTPKSTPVKNDTSSLESFSEIIKIEPRGPVEETASERDQIIINTIHINTNDSPTKADTSLREEVIENIEQFIQNYDEQKFSNELSSIGKQLNGDTLKCDNDRIENVVNVLTMDDDLNQSGEDKDTSKKRKEDIADGDDKSLRHNHVHIAASVDQITQKSKVKYRIPKIKSQESPQSATPVVLDEPSDIFLSNVNDITCKLPSKVEETVKGDAVDKNSRNSETEPTSASSDSTARKAECINDTSDINTVNVKNDVRSNNKETSELDRHIDDDINGIKVEKNNLEGFSLCNKVTAPDERTSEVPKEEIVALFDKVVALKSTNVDTSSKVSITDDVRVTDKDTVNPERTNSLAEENKPENCRDNKQIKGCSNNSSKTNENKGGNNDRSKVIVARRRKPVQLGDMNASMTIVMSQTAVKSNDNVNTVSESSNTLKPRACKVPRSYKKIN